MTWSAKLAPWPSVANAGRAVDFYKSAVAAAVAARRGFFAARARRPNHVEMLGLDPGRGPAGHTKTAGHPTPA